MFSYSILVCSRWLISDCNVLLWLLQTHRVWLYHNIVHYLIFSSSTLWLILTVWFQWFYKLELVWLYHFFIALFQIFRVLVLGYVTSCIPSLGWSFFLPSICSFILPSFHLFPFLILPSVFPHSMFNGFANRFQFDYTIFSTVVISPRRFNLQFTTAHVNSLVMVHSVLLLL